MLRSIQVRKGILEDPIYKHLFSVEVVNELVLQGVPFRDAYKRVGQDIESGTFVPNQNKVEHTHEGSIGNLCLPEIKAKHERQVAKFDFKTIDTAYSKLLS
jgi:argininosuccinate lyase